MRQWARGLHSLYRRPDFVLTDIAKRPTAWPEAPPIARTALEIAAHHEAGHAVIMWRHGHAFESICIYPDRPGLGRVQCRSVLDELPPPQLWRRDESTWQKATASIQREVEWTLAGPLAEARCIAEPIGPVLASFDDVYEAIGLLGRLKHAELGRKKLTPKEIKEVYRDLNAAQERVTRLLAEPWLWQTIEALAQLVLARGSLPGAEASEIIRRQAGEPWISGSQSPDRPSP